MTEPKKRPWWKVTRIQGIVTMAVGIGLLFNPITAASAPTVIAVGAGWAGGGVNAKASRGE